MQARWYRDNAERIKAKLKADYDRDSEAKKLAARSYYEANTEACKARVAARKLRLFGPPKNIPRKTPEELAEAVKRRRAKWNAANPDKIRKAISDWDKRNRDKRRTYLQKYRAGKTEAGGSFSVSEWRALINRAGMCCSACGRTGALAADHIIPVSWGGPSWIWNIQPLCRSCNSRKSDTMIISYMPAEPSESTIGADDCE